MTDVAAIDRTAPIHPASEKHQQRLSFWSAALIVAGTSVGAGMFSLPVMTSGIWFSWSVFIFFIVWFCAYSSALYLMEVSLYHPLGASFDTLAKATIGPVGRIINGFSLVFVCYVLLYAYVSGGSSVILHTAGLLSELFATPGSTVEPLITAVPASFIFVLLLATVVVIGPVLVGPATTIMLGGMILTFITFSVGLLAEVNMNTLMPSLPLGETSSFVLAAVPAVVVSFGFHTCVPSIVKYLNHDANSIRKALLAGSLMALGLYIFWQLSILGNLPRKSFVPIIQAGGNIADLVGALDQIGLNIGATWALTLFSHLAIASSFLGVALGLYGFIADLMGWTDQWPDRLKTAVITFVPPTLFGMAFPDGFISAISFASIGVTIFCLITPALMVYINRKMNIDSTKKPLFTVHGGDVRIAVVILCGSIVIICEVLRRFNKLPLYG